MPKRVTIREASHSHLPSRRRCLAGLLAALAPLLGASAARSWARTGPDRTAQAVLDMLGDAARARAIGGACLQALPPAERTAERLVGAICGDGTRPKTSARLVHARVRRDFAEGRMVTVDGWFLSMTEARLYALAALV